MGNSSSTNGHDGTGLGLDIFMKAGATLIFDLSSDLTILNSIVSDPGSGGGLEKTGAATLTLSGNNSYVGATTLTQGTISVNADNNLGVTTGSLIFKGGTLQSTATFTSARAVSLNSTGIIDVTSGNTLTVSGVFSGAGGLTKENSGALVLTASSENTYSGPTSIHAGTLRAGATNALSPNSSTSLANTSGAVLDLNNFSNTIGTLSGGGTTGGNIILGNGNLTINNTSDSTYSGIINGSGHINKQGTGTLVLTGANIYTGGTTITDGILSVSADNNLGNSIGSLILNGGILQSTATFASNRAATLSSTGIIDVTSGNILTMSGIFSGSGSLTKANTGILILTGVNTYTGGTTVSSGILQGNTTSLQGAITNNANVIFDQATTGTYAGVMSGSGTLTKQNTGTLILTGANTYAGGTMVTAGTLQGNTISLQGNITDNAALVFDQTTTGTYSGILTGSGSLTKQGTATLIFSDNSSSFTGTTLINAGTFLINGQLGGSCTVSSGATLGGNGTIGSVTNSGTVSPGTSIGTLTINGNYTQDPTGTLFIEITSDGATDLLQVTGAATLDGTLEVSAEPGVYDQGTTYTILTASTRTGEFSTFNKDPSLAYEIEYQPNQVILTAPNPSIILPKPNLCGNSQAMSQYLFCRSFDFSNKDLIQVVKALIKAGIQSPPGEYRASLVKLTPVQLGALPLTELETNYTLAHTFFVAGTGQRSPCYTDQSINAWLNPLGFIQSQDDQSIPGSCSQKAFGFTNHTYGVAGGMDHLFNDHWSLGSGIGYTHTKLDFKHNAGKAQANTAYLGPYLKYDSEYFYFDVLLLGACNFYDLERKIAFPGFARKASSDFVSWNLSEILLAGARLETLDQLYFQPEILLDQLNTFQQSFKESGAHSINLAVKSQYSAFFRSLLNAKFVKEWYISGSCFTPSLNVGWLRTIPFTGGHYTAKFKTGTFCQPDFTVSSFHKTIDQLLIGIQLLISQGDFDFSAGYEGKFGGGSTVNELNVAMHWRF